MVPGRELSRGVAKTWTGGCAVSVESGVDAGSCASTNGVTIVRSTFACSICTEVTTRAARCGWASGAAPAAPAIGVKPEEVMATLEKLGELKTKGILTQEEFDAKKAELLKKLV